MVSNVLGSSVGSTEARTHDEQGNVNRKIHAYIHIYIVDTTKLCPLSRKIYEDRTIGRNMTAGSMGTKSGLKGAKKSGSQSQGPNDFNYPVIRDSAAL